MRCGGSDVFPPPCISGGWGTFWEKHECKYGTRSCFIAISFTDADFMQIIIATHSINEGGEGGKQIHPTTCSK